MNSSWCYSPETPNLGQIRRFLEPCDLEIWRMTLKNHMAPLLCYGQKIPFIKLLGRSLKNGRLTVGWRTDERTRDNKPGTAWYRLRFTDSVSSEAIKHIHDYINSGYNDLITIKELHDVMLPVCCSHIYWHGLTLIPAWISNYMPRKVWDKITYPFLNSNGCTVEV